MPPCAERRDDPRWRYNVLRFPDSPDWSCWAFRDDLGYDASAEGEWYDGPDPVAALRAAILATDPRLLGSVPPGHPEICLEAHG